MVEQNLAEQLKDESIRIGDSILNKAIQSPDGIFWKTLSLTKDKEVVWNISESIYSGNSGIILYFIELYNFTKDKKYLDAILSATNWLYKSCCTSSNNSYSFLTGRMGVCYTLLEVAILTNDAILTSKALDLAKNCDDFINENGINEYLNGYAGAILGLLHLHSHTQKPWLLEKIKRFTDNLINNCNVDKHGVYWDRSYRDIKGLCGFSHGASGIGYVFLELGNYFNCNNFFMLARQAFLYENSQFNKNKGNWPDLRKLNTIDNLSFVNGKEAYLNGNTSCLFEVSDMVAWCHGAPGIGLSRLRAEEILNNGEFDEDLLNAINKTRLDSNRLSSILCHGKCGNAMLFLEHFRYTKNQQSLNEALEIAFQSLDSYRKTKMYSSGYGYSGSHEDLSLFMGTAGIGYFYLQVLNPIKVKSILLPRVQKMKIMQGSYQLDNREILEKIQKKIFPRTTLKLHPISYPYLDSHISIYDYLIDLLDTETSKFEINDSTRNMYHLEKLKLLTSQSANNFFLYIKENVEREISQNILAKTEEELLDLCLKLNEGSTLVQENSAPNCTLLRPTWFGAEEIPINQFSFTIVEIFGNGKSIKRAIDEIIQLVDLNSGELRQYKLLIISQIRELLKSRILIYCESD